MLPETIDRAQRRSLADSAGTTSANGSRRSSAERPKVELLLAIRQRPWLVLAAGMMSVAAALVYLSFATPVFESSAKLDIQKNTPKLIADTVEQQQFNSLYTDSQIIQSTAVLEDTIKTVGLDNLPTLKNVEDPVLAIKSSLKVDADPQGQILDISLNSTRSEDAALIVNGVVSSYIGYIDGRSQSSAATVLSMLQAEKNKRELELSDLEKKMLEFQLANGILSFDDSRSDSSGSAHSMGNNIITTRLAELSDLHTKAEVDLLNAQIAVNTANSLKNNPEQLSHWVEAQNWLRSSQNSSQPLITSDPDIKEASVKLEELEEEYGRDSMFGPVLQARRKLDLVIRSAAAAKAALVSEYVMVLQTQLLNAQQREHELANQLDKQRDLAMNLNDKVAHYNQLSADAARTERLLDIIDNRLKEVDVNSDSKATVNILESAKASNSPVSPKRSKVLGLALVLGLMSGIAATVVFDRFDHRLRSAEDIATLLDLPVLGVIPRMERHISAIRRSQMVRVDPKSEVAEAYRTVRTALFFCRESEAQTILVTSPMPVDGKSACASNLALAFAQTDNNVLLIDCDMRRPVQHLQFAIGNAPGLSEVLSGEAGIEAAIHRSSVDRLHILPCGKTPEHPAELLNSGEFRTLLQRLCSEYDKIVIDSPPLVPVTDARILSTISNVTVLVVRAERSTRKAIEHARDSLLSVGGTLVGAVVNDVPRSGFGSYHYGFKGGYRYGPRYARKDSDIRDITSNGKAEEHHLLT